CNVDQRKLLSVLCHGSIFFSYTILSIGVPIVVLLTTDDSVVKENAKESLNFHINIFIYVVISVLLIAVLIGIPLLFVFGIVSIIMPIIAIVKVLDNSDIPYKYPFIFRFF
ncbi:MAG: DUF4870 domain-containing protein, partial [Symploca sp. SIO1A3]|nr:DUF4870 domain-containing protein [Symploca sp. SIO1A3]